MQPLDPAGNYTDAEVIDALTGRRGARVMSFRFDRLDELNNYIEPLDYVTGGKVINNALADIKRTATFTLLDQGGINYLKDRIRPWARLAVKGHPVVGAGDVVRTNYALDPTYENGAGWSSYYTPTVSAEYSITHSPGRSRKITTTGAHNEGVIVEQSQVLGNGTFRASIWMLGPAGEQWTAAVRTEAPNSESLGFIAFESTGDWQLVQVEGNLVAGPYLLAGMQVRQQAAKAGVVAYFDDVALWGPQEFGPVFSGDNTDADVAGGYVYDWLGTPNNSASTRRELIELPDTRPGYVEWPLGVFLLATPKRTLGDDNVVRREVTAYDQLLVLTDDKVVDRYSIAAGTKYTDAINTLTFGLARAVIPSSLALPAPMEWEPGTTKLRILNDLLGAINYEGAWFDERGVLICRPYQSPTDRAPEYDYATDARSVIGGELGQTVDLFSVPNRWVMVKSEADQAPLTATYTNTSSSSPTSTVSRGRVIVDFRTEEDAADQATLDAKVARLAFEASQVFENITFVTAAMPLHSNADVINLEVAELGIDGKYSEHTWELPLETGARMSHTVRRVVSV